MDDSPKPALSCPSIDLNMTDAGLRIGQIESIFQREGCVSLDLKDVTLLAEQAVTEIADLLCVDREVSWELLRSFNWSGEAVKDHWFNNEEKTAEQCGVLFHACRASTSHLMFPSICLRPPS